MVVYSFCLQIFIYRIPTPTKMKVESTFFVELSLCLGMQLEGQLREGGREGGRGRGREGEREREIYRERERNKEIRNPHLLPLLCSGATSSLQREQANSCYGWNWNCVTSELFRDLSLSVANITLCHILDGDSDFLEL